jgi:hypothetical protein
MITSHELLPTHGRHSRKVALMPARAAFLSLGSNSPLQSAATIEFLWLIKQPSVPGPTSSQQLAMARFRQ